MRRLVLILSLMFISFSAAAADHTAELLRLQSALGLLNQEQEAVYRQFQMVQELRRTNSQGVSGTLTTQLSPLQYSEGVPNYSDVVEAQKNQLRRGDELAQQAQDLYDKYSEIEARKRPIQQRIYELTLPK